MIEIVQVTEGRKYFRRVPHVGQPCSKSTGFCSPAIHTAIHTRIVIIFSESGKGRNTWKVTISYRF